MTEAQTKPAAAVAHSADNDKVDQANTEKDSYGVERDRNERKRTSDRGGRAGARGRGGRGRGGRDFKSDYKHDRRDGDHRKAHKPKTSDDPDEIREQVEFYFSDSNLNKDAFLFEKTGGAANNPIDIETIASFSRMRRFQPLKAIVKALKESDVLVVNDEGQVSRKEPLVSLSNDFEENKRLVNERALPVTLYVKGWRPATEIGEIQDTVRDFFKPYGVEEVRIRRHGDGSRVFKGSVFVEFPDLESAHKFSAQVHTYDGKVLEVLFKQDFIKREVDAFLTELDTGEFKDDSQKEKALEDARKILELEYMDPQAPPTVAVKKGEDSAEDADSPENSYNKLVIGSIEKVHKKRNDELQARLKSKAEKEKGFRKGNYHHDNKRKRNHGDSGKSAYTNNKRRRSNEEAANGADNNEEAATKPDVSSHHRDASASDAIPAEAAAADNVVSAEPATAIDEASAKATNTGTETATDAVAAGHEVSE